VSALACRDGIFREIPFENCSSPEQLSFDCSEKLPANHHPAMQFFLKENPL
jgi:hypothetical protein